MTRKRLLIAGAAVVIIAAVYFARGMFGSADQPMGNFGTPVETVKVTPRSLDMTLEAVGTLVANESVVIRPEIAGRITEILFTEGQPLKKGDRLFQIDDRVARAELKQAAANLELARLNDARFSKLANSGAATKRTRDEARANLGVASANYDLAKTRVDYASITAPFDGTIGLRSVSPGDYVNVGQELANFVSYDPMKVNFTIPETQVSQLGVGQQLDITVEAIPGETFRGTVFALDPQLDVSGRAVALRATIPNPEYRLKPGFFARISLIVDNKADALVIPESAIVPQGDAKFVFKVQMDDTVALTPITLGKRLEGEVEVLSGLAAGDEVVTSGQIKLQPGAKISRLPAKAPETPPAAVPAEPVPAAEPAPAGEPVPLPTPEETQAVPAEPVPASEEDTVPAEEAAPTEALQ